MAWTAPRTWVPNETLTAALLNTHLRDNFNELDVAKITGYGDYIVSTAANAVAARQYGWDRIDTSQSTTSTSYTNLATTGPSVTLTTGTKAIVFFASFIQTPAAAADALCCVSYAISGATTSASSDNRAIIVDGLPANQSARYCQIDWRTDLTAGSNTFTMQYRCGGSSTSFDYRLLMVLPL